MSLDIKSFLKKIPPFSLLPDEEISHISQRAKLDYIPKDQTVIKQGEKVDSLFVVLKGSLSLKKNGNLVDILQEEDFIGDTSLIFNQPYQFDVKAVKDSILIIIPSQVFKGLLEKHPEFKEFFTKTTINKLTEGYKNIQSHLEDISITPINTFKLKKAVFCKDTDSITTIVKKMCDENLSYCLVGDRANLTGIITDKDLKDKVLAKALPPNTTTAGEIKTYPVETIQSDSFVFEAVLKMIKKNIKRLPVVEKGQVIGVIEDRDIFIHQSRNIVYLSNQIEMEDSIDNLRELYITVEDAIEPLFKTGKDIEILQKYIAEINDRFVKKAIQLALKEVEVDNFSFLVLGSEGRREQTINTDIDNSLVFLSGNRERFLQFGKKVIQILLQIGFPECEGKV
ncbi:MAG: cyclic nucleotide-binding domain-containing protein, partial [Aquificae bacterium]|nr:cyclic nucleotide-binding domain-containing protein [Aquificota bacterium]